MAIYKQGTEVPVEVGYEDVATFADLPEAADNVDKICIVKIATGTLFVNRKRAGLYRSDGVVWKRLGQIVLAGAESPVAGFLPSNPPVGAYVVSNIYRNFRGNIEYEYDTEPKS